MRKLVSPIVLAGVAVVITSGGLGQRALANETNFRIPAFGQGSTLTCGDWLKVRAHPSAEGKGLDSWVLGYVDATISEDTSFEGRQWDLGHITDEQLLVLVDAQCKADPDEFLAGAIVSLVASHLRAPSN